MSIPPLLSRSPPPICDMTDDDDDDDDFGSFVVNNELVVDISQAPDILDNYEKKTGKRCEDTTSDDSGLCMSSMGQTQSPCDNSPVSSSYIQSNTSENGLNASNNGFLFSNTLTRNTEDCSLPTCSPDSLSNGIIIRQDCIETVDHTTGSLQLDNLSIEDDVVNTDLNTEEKPDTHFELSDTVLNEEESRLPVANNDVSDDYREEEEEEEEEKCQIKHDNIIKCDNSLTENNTSVEVYTSEIGCHEEFEPFEHFSDHKNTIQDFMNSPMNADIDERKAGHYDNSNGTIEESINPPTNRVVASNGLLQELKINDGIRNDENFEEPPSNPICENLTEKISNNAYIPDLQVSVESSSEGTDEEFCDFQSSLYDINHSKDPSISNNESQMENLWMQWWTTFEPSPAVVIHLDEELRASRVWIHLHQLDCSPALSYQWPTSASNCKLLSALKIDSRNILFGPWNKFKFSSTEGLAVLDCVKNFGLKEKLEISDVTIPSKDPVPDAHFDWVGSGLVNPLDCVSTTLLDLQLLTFARVSTSKIVPSSLLLSMHGCKDIGEDNSTKTPKLSRKAFEVLQTLPDLSFMRKPFIVFPKCAV